MHLTEKKKTEKTAIIADTYRKPQTELEKTSKPHKTPKPSKTEKPQFLIAKTEPKTG